MAHDGTALGALTEIIENAGGTSDAQTLVPAIEDLGEIIAAGGGGGGTTDYNVRLIAADAQTAQVLTQVGMKVSATCSPAQMAEDKRYLDSRNRLCWIFNNEGEMALESAALSFSGNLEDKSFALIARGSISLAWGVLGVDESWTIAANA